MTEDDPRDRPADPAGTKPKVDPSSLVAERGLPVPATAVELDGPDLLPAGDEPHQLLPERLARAGAPALAGGPVPTPHAARFQFLRGGLIALGLAAVAGIVVIAVAGTGGGGNGAPGRCGSRPRPA